MKILVCGGGGFIGGHLVKKLKEMNHNVTSVDLKENIYSNSYPDKNLIGDLTNQEFVKDVLSHEYDEIYQLAADMGGAGYIFTGDNDSSVMYNSATINLNVLNCLKNNKKTKIFYSSSACIYPEYNQLDPDNPECKEDSAYPAAPDSEYGWEKLFSERLYLTFKKNYNLNIRIARFHNIFGPEGAWNNGKEKAPAAICRKVGMAKDGDHVEIWGDGLQTRSFLYIDECLEAVLRLMQSNFIGPVNIGSEQMISINNLVKMVAKISNKNVKINNVDGPTGVRGRNSNNDLIFKKLNWKPTLDLEYGLKKTYDWISEQIKLNEN
tara:strand:+ start:272 stop:1237 length:966 start_codon:yes stop_codon:yes gene_type:complete